VTNPRDPNDDHTDDGSEEPSRSQRRREALAVFDLAEVLVNLPAGKLEAVPLSDELRTVVAHCRRITQQIARKREIQYLAKHLRRNEDALPAIRASLERDRDDQRVETAKLHRLEAWRERLIAEGDAALAELLQEHPNADRQHLRQLARNAASERAANKPPASARELFKELRALFEEGQP
jgi:ribosome-associated protein